MERSFGSKYGKWIALTAVVLALVLWFVLSGGVENYRAKYEGYDLSQQIGDIGRSSTYSLYLRAHEGAPAKREYDFLRETPGAEVLLVSYADELEDLLGAAEQLNAASQNADVLKLVKLYPFTDELIDTVSKYKIVLFAEECVATGGIGEHLACALQQKGWNGCFLHCAVHTACLPHATVPQIKQSTGLDAEHLAQAIRTWKGAES